MSLPSVSDLAVFMAVAGLLWWCAVCDLRSRKIPNRAVLALIAVYCVSATLGWTSPLLSGAAAGAIALLVGFILYCTKVVGAGDAKLFAAVALFAGLSLLPALALATVLAGGAMVVVVLLANPRRALLLITSQGRLGTSEGLPYGVAIAIGGCLVLGGRALHPL